MKLKRTIAMALLSTSLVFSGLFVSTPSLAGGAHHHHHRDNYQDDSLADALVAGLAVGVIAGSIVTASDNTRTVYVTHRHCHRRTFWRQHCHFNRWGDRVCRNRRVVQNWC